VRATGERVLSGVVLAVLVLALALLPVLLMLTVRTAAASLTVGRFSAASCGVASTERCYGAVVTNTGQQDTSLRCTLISEGGPPATFFNAAPSGSILPAGSSVTLLIKLQPSANVSPALPKLSCAGG
jgi:hypothetical protein